MCENLTSSIYRAKVMHHRLAPKKHMFWYTIYLFYIDIDKIDNLSNELTWFSRNRFNLFSFRDRDHLQLPKENPAQGKTIKQHVSDYLKAHKVEIGDGKIMLLTNLAVLGYNFNPVSFYFCFDENAQPLCAIAEISNTYREMKLFFFGKEELHHLSFKQQIKKEFYVSPFIDLDAFFDFNLTIPTDKLEIKIDDYDKNGNRFFISTLTGKSIPLTTRNMLRHFFSMPLLPLQVMGLIHWQALKLWFKKLNYHPKAANQHLQKDVYKRY
ncbi:MAG: DUF1365 domain-containing protein [Chitinophagaceae bacterium]|nr:MAG: DUF1365 domain-containing protein [Chitinophagaceae bacterium]